MKTRHFCEVCKVEWLSKSDKPACPVCHKEVRKQSNDGLKVLK